MTGSEIVLQGLTKRYDGRAVVNDVSAVILAGSFFSLLGPSGSGKTSTLMMLAGFVAPEPGRILLDGRDVTADSPQRHGLGMVFQNYALFPHLSVAGNVAFSLRVQRRTAAEIRDKRWLRLLSRRRTCRFGWHNRSVWSDSNLSLSARSSIGCLGPVHTKRSLAQARNRASG